MCGIFGYLSETAKPSLTRLRKLALHNQSRGADAFGLAWVDSQGGIGAFKRQGPASANLDMLELVRDAVLIVGHCRKATRGAPDDDRNNHPHRAGRGWIVHNGTVWNHEQLIAQYDLRPQSDCDSEVLGLLLAQIPGKLESRASKTTRAAAGDMAILGAWADPVRMLVVRREKPLNFGRNKTGLYLSSLELDLPGEVRAVKNRWAGVLAL